MSVYQRPPRSDELYHWGHKGFHKYIAKIGNRYFYTQEEVEAFKKAGVEGQRQNAQHQVEARKLHNKADEARIASSKAGSDSKAVAKQASKDNRKATYAWTKEERDEGLKEYNKSMKRSEFLKGREKGLQRTAEANDRIAQDHERQGQKALDDAKRKQENITKDKSLLTQVAFKRAVEKEDRERKKKAQREAGKKRVQDWFRKKGWIY